MTQRALDEISVLSLCGYYGFCNYDHAFIRACKERGIVILEDVTHSMLSADGIDPLCDYFAGSFRKWMGIACGGIAVKRNGKFAKPLLPVDPTHLRQREAAIETAESDVFWEGEMRLRQMFDSFAGDERSEYILRHADFDAICAARRANFSAILNGLPKELHGIRPVFPILTDAAVPSHFCLYAERGTSSRHFWQSVRFALPSTGRSVLWYIRRGIRRLRTFMIILFPFPVISAISLRICSVLQRRLPLILKILEGEYAGTT